MRTSVLSLEPLHIFTPIFFTSMSSFIDPFKESHKFLNFSFILAYGSGVESTQIFFSKNFKRTPVWSRRNIMYTHTIFSCPIPHLRVLIWESYKSLNILCVLAYWSSARSTQFFPQKDYKDLWIEFGKIIYTRTIVFKFRFAYTGP